MNKWKGALNGLSYFKIKTYPSLEAPPNPEGDSKYLDSVGYGTKINEKIEKEDAKKKSPEERFKTFLNNLMTGRLRVNHLS